MALCLYVQLLCSWLSFHTELDSAAWWNQGLTLTLYTMFSYILIRIVFSSEPPATFLNKQENNILSAFENESVTLCAVVNRGKANVRWMKDGQLLNRDNIHISSDGQTQRLSINPLQLSDSGEYVCDVHTDQMYFSVLVKGKTLALCSKYDLGTVLIWQS